VFEIGVLAYVDEVPVVESGSPYAVLVEAKAQETDQMHR
jgi:hypothetical protein